MSQDNSITKCVSGVHLDLYFSELTQRFECGACGKHLNKEVILAYANKDQLQKVNLYIPVTKIYYNIEPLTEEENKQLKKYGDGGYGLFTRLELIIMGIVFFLIVTTAILVNI